MKKELYAVSVVVQYGYAGEGRYGWQADLHWNSGGILTDGFVEGVISTRYFEETLTDAVSYVWDIKEQFGLQDIPMGVALFYKGDGEDPSNPPPSGYRALLKEEAEKREWKTYGNLV